MDTPEDWSGRLTRDGSDGGALLCSLGGAPAAPLLSLTYARSVEKTDSG